MFGNSVQGIVPTAPPSNPPALAVTSGDTVVITLAPDQIRDSNQNNYDYLIKWSIPALLVGLILFLIKVVLRLVEEKFNALKQDANPQTSHQTDEIQRCIKELAHRIDILENLTFESELSIVLQRLIRELNSEIKLEKANRRKFLRFFRKSPPEYAPSQIELLDKFWLFAQLLSHEIKDDEKGKFLDILRGIEETLGCICSLPPKSRMDMKHNSKSGYLYHVGKKQHESH
ncbi:hypothetical protein JXJ21_02940 [candidate division KSB1 bacterium]|nr:hypothetical protein [candidate division KSB1 bacterium]